MTTSNVIPLPIPSPATATGWDTAVFSKLAEWERTPLEADAEFDPPTPESIRVARAQAVMLRDAGEPPPTRVGPDGSGGVAFEALDGRVLVVRIEISDVGRVDRYTVGIDGRTMQHTSVVRWAGHPRLPSTGPSRSTTRKSSCDEPRRRSAPIRPGCRNWTSSCRIGRTARTGCRSPAGSTPTRTRSAGRHRRAGRATWDSSPLARFAGPGWTWCPTRGRATSGTH